MTNHDLSDGIGLLECMRTGGNVQAAAILSHIDNLETRILDMRIFIDELRAELRDRTQQVQAYKNQLEADLAECLRDAISTVNGMYGPNTLLARSVTKDWQAVLSKVTPSGLTPDESGAAAGEP